MDHRRTISPAYYEKMAEAKAVFCSYCTLGAMLFWEDCEGCKIQRMFHAVQRTIKEEMPPKEQGAIVQEQNTYEGIDLPREMIESIGKGPATEGGFRTSPEFIIWEDGMYEAFRLQLVEEKTGLPDFAGTDDLPPTQIHTVLSEGYLCGTRTTDHHGSDSDLGYQLCKCPEGDKVCCGPTFATISGQPLGH